MPNWCSNTAQITAPKPVIDEIRQVIADQQGLLNWMVPRPADQEDNWYDWNISNWGTKWDVDTAEVVDDNEEDSIVITFDTAWAPPLDAFRTWAERDGRVTFELSFFEPGVGFVGRANYDGEFFDEDSVDCQTDPEAYRQRAQDDWGWEFEEDEEPLTEWLVSGIEAKKEQ